MPLIAAFEHQDKVFSSAFSILEAAIAVRTFPAASIAVTHQGRLVALKAFGNFTYIDESAGAPSFSRRSREGGDFDFASGKLESGTPSFASFAKGGRDASNPTTLFDLASLTKVVATTPMAMILYQRGLLDLDAPVASIIPEFTTDAEKNPRRKQDT